MDDEIREILDDLENVSYLPNISYQLNHNKVKKLYDYITNLQQKKEKLEIALQNIQEDYDKRVSEITNLQQENERLKEENNNKAMNDYAHAIDESWYRELYDDYKSRCEKAVEYIKFEWEEIVEDECYENHLWPVDGLVIKKILNILQNGSDSQ